ncbi:MAG TPA: transglycosylase domain-containing protein [Candidatus Limivivens merdigallinarum]|uniref:Penicillin-binding protein 1A n=1 Tax=Candidatus Limivivens merdigallinarum TaxID=2840859 RepID=A0A9D1CZJ2_9FIRM|nr:transglycosylase domain-containing protein [Candidatus Limivivens merdigallinarum]
MKKILKHLVILWLLFMLVAVGGITFKGYQLYKEAVSSVSLETKFEEMKQGEHYTNYEELPEIYIQAVISVEDKRFFQHPGIDVKSICRAIIHNIQAGALVEGGSTITQQLAKNLYFDQEKSFLRKIAEVFMAFDIEGHYTKKEIFEWYVNTIYFGEGYYGIGSACLGYYGKEPEAMTDEEAMTLAGIPNAPSLYNPRANQELCRERMLQVKRAMENY